MEPLHYKNYCTRPKFLKILTKYYLEYPKILIHYALHVAHYACIVLQHEQHNYEGLLHECSIRVFWNYYGIIILYPAKSEEIYSIASYQNFSILFAITFRKKGSACESKMGYNWIAQWAKWVNWCDPVIYFGTLQ